MSCYMNGAPHGDELVQCHGQFISRPTKRVQFNLMSATKIQFSILI